jgi:hypothetical protein
LICIDINVGKYSPGRIIVPKLGEFEFLPLNSKFIIDVEDVPLRHFFVRGTERGIRMGGVVMTNQQVPI